MDSAAVRTAVDLLDAINVAQQAEGGAVIRYEYPPHVIEGMTRTTVYEIFKVCRDYAEAPLKDREYLLNLFC